MPKKDELGRPVSEKTEAAPSAILVAPRALDSVMDFLTYTGPMIQSILRRGGMGDLAAQLTMFTRMIESDSHLSSTVQTRRQTIGKAEQRILPHLGMEEDSKAIIAAEYTRNVTSNVIGWRNFIRSSIDGPVKGFYGAEIIWDGVVPIQLADTPDDGWRWSSSAQHGSVTGNWDTGFQSGNMAGELSGGLQYRDVFGKWNQVPADKFIIHAPRGNSASFVRRGIMRAISRYWLIKAIATGDWASFVELFGIPYRKLTYPDNISEGDPALDQVIEAITMMGASGVVGLKKGWELELVTSSSGNSSSGSPHEAIVRWCDAQVSKNVLGQTLTTDSTQATGTYSLGVIHDEVRLGLAEDDAGGIAETTERDLFEPLVRYGLGPEYPVPRLALIVEGKKDPKTRADVISVAVNELGLPVTKATAYSDLRIDPPPAGIADEDLLEGKGETQPALFRGDLGTTIQRFIAEGVTGPRTPAQDALDVLAAQGAEDWRQIERESIPEAVAAMVRSNPNMTPDDIEARLVKMYLHQDPEEMAAVLEDTMNAAIVNGSLESELEAPTPKPDEEE